MTFKHVFLSTAAASSLLLAVAAVEPTVFSLATIAQATTNISVSINFYDDLAPYGSWVSYHDRYVWIPEDVDARWRPYTEGRWAYTRSYGWIWISDERFGWATYHYGRWGYARDIGWYWVPGRRWAPAWVAWRYDDNHIAWAPLPPDDDDSFGDIPDYYWQAVPVSAFLSVDLSGHVYRDRDGARHGEPRTVRILNNIVLNNVIKVDDIEKKTKKKVVVLEEKAVDKPDAAGKTDSNSVTIFNPEVKEEPNARPKKIAKIEEVVKVREAKGIPDEEQPSGLAATTIDEPVTKPEKNKAATDAVVPQDEQQNADQQPATEKKEETTASIDQPTMVTQAPAAPEPALPTSKTVSLDTVAYDQSGNIVFGGRGPVGSEVQLYVDNNPYGLAGINDKGTWTFAGVFPLTVGTHTLRAQEIGRDGAMKSHIEMPFYREDPAKIATAPLIPAMPEASKPAEVATGQEVPALTPPVDRRKKKDAVAPDQQAVEKSAQASAEEQAAPVENKEKKATASIDQPDIEKTVEAPADEQTVPVKTKQKKKAEEPATLSKAKLQSTKRVIPKTNLHDAGAESWRINCSPRFGGFSKASETYLSSAGKHVSCAWPPKNARG